MEHDGRKRAVIIKDRLKKMMSKMFKKGLEVVGDKEREKRERERRMFVNEWVCKVDLTY